MGLNYNTVYYRQVAVKDGVNTVKGDVWSFKTVEFPEWQHAFARRLNSAYQIFALTAATGSVRMTTNCWCCPQRADLPSQY